MDCGPSCIRMIAAFYGKKYALHTLKEYCNVTRLGISVSDLVKGCEKIGLKAIPARVPMNRIEDLPLPAILYWHQDHFVVLYQIVNKKESTIFYLCDPSYGRVKLSQEYFVKQWVSQNEKGIAIVIEPTEKFSKIQLPKEEKVSQTVKELCDALFRKHIKATILVSVFFAIALIANWFIPIFFQRMIDEGIGAKSVNILFLLLLAQLFFFVGNMVSSGLTNMILTKVNLTIGLNMLSSYILKLTKLPISFFDTKLNTDLIQRIDDQARIQDFMTSHLVNFFINILNIAVFSTMLFYYNKTVFVFYLCFSSLALLWADFFMDKVKVLDYSRFIISAENKNNVYDLITGMKEVKINSAQKNKLLSFIRLKDRLNDIAIKSLRLNYCIYFGSSFINRLKDILILGCASYLVIMDQLSIGILLSINYILDFYRFDLTD